MKYLYSVAKVRSAFGRSAEIRPQNGGTAMASSSNTECLLLEWTPTYLQSVLKELVHPRHLRRNAEVDRAVANLDDQAAADVGVDL